MFEDRIKTDADVPQPRILLYGREKGGKTTFASEFPDALILDIEGGAKNLSVPRISDIKGSDDLIAILKEIGAQAKEGKTPYKWLIIDSIDWLANMIADEICKQPEHEQAKDIGDNAHNPFSYGRGWKMVANKVSIILNILDRLIAYDIKPILVAHTKVRQTESPLESAYDKYELKLSNAVSGRIKEWVDCILFLKDKFHVSKEGKPMAPERWIYAEAHPAYEGGGRYNIPNFEYKLGEGYATFNKLLTESTNQKGEEDENKQKTSAANN